MLSLTGPQPVILFSVSKNVPHTKVISTRRDRQTRRTETDRQTNRQIDRQRQTETNRDRQRLVAWEVLQKDIIDINVDHLTDEVIVGIQYRE